MRLFISVDLEGIPGVIDTDQTRPGGYGYEAASTAMTNHANAAIEGALSAGATSIVVADSHLTMRNIKPDLLHPAAELIQGTPRPLSMVEGVEGCDAAIFLGYHARAGASRGLLSHTYAGRLVQSMRLNGNPASESYINAAVCGAFKVPVLLISGDDVLAEEVRQILPSTRMLITKESIGRTAARSVSPGDTNLELRAAAEDAVRAATHKNGGGALILGSPFEFSVSFLTPGMAELAALLPGSVRSDGATVTYASTDLLESFKGMLAMLLLARGAPGESRK